MYFLWTDGPMRVMRGMFLMKPKTFGENVCNVLSVSYSFTLQSPKNDNTTTFFIKQKMLGIYGFHNKFSILGPSDLIECAPDGPEPHGHEIGLSSPWEGSN